MFKIGQNCNSREIPLEVKRRFAWVFASAALSRCVDMGAEIELHDDGDGVAVFVWREIKFALHKHSDIALLGEKISMVDWVLPNNLPEKHEKWAFMDFDTKDNVGVLSLAAAQNEKFVKIFPDGTDVFESELPVFAALSLANVENPLELLEKISEYDCMKGIAIVNNCPPSEKELPEKAIEIIKNAGFNGTAQYKVFVGYRE